MIHSQPLPQLELGTGQAMPARQLSSLLAIAAQPVAPAPPAELHDVLAPLWEGIEADEERVWSNFPSILWSVFVVEVNFFELSTDIQSGS